MDSAYIYIHNLKDEMFFFRKKMIRLYLFLEVLNSRYHLTGSLYRKLFLTINSSFPNSIIKRHILTFPHSIINFPVYES